VRRYIKKPAKPAKLYNISRGGTPATVQRLLAQTHIYTRAKLMTQITAATIYSKNLHNRVWHLKESIMRLNIISV